MFAWLGCKKSLKKYKQKHVKHGVICVKGFLWVPPWCEKTLVHIVVAKSFFQARHLGDTFFGTKNVHFFVGFSVQLSFDTVGASSNFFRANKYARESLTQFFASKICET